MTDADVTGLLHKWAEGDPGARDQLVPVVYAELRRRAAAQLRRERGSLGMQPTELVHEAYIRLVNQRRAQWHNRAQFFAVAAETMRRVLVDRARAHLAAKRSGRWARVTLGPAAALAAPADIDVLDLDAALSRLAAIDPRKSEIAVLRFFAGLSLHESAAALDLSLATVERDWQFARAWLYDALSEPRPDDD
jgi:RNA polymerase sigma factor (TIGR02999 family)